MDDLLSRATSKTACPILSLLFLRSVRIAWLRAILKSGKCFSLKFGGAGT